MKQFFQRFGWVICMLLTVVLSAAILAQFFNTMVVVVTLTVFTMVVGLGIVLWRFRRHFVNLCLICILFVSLTSLVYNTGIFNGYIGVVFKGIEVKEDVNVKGDTVVDGKVEVGQDVHVKGDTVVDGSVTVKENVNVDGGVTVKEDVTVEGNVNVKKDVKVDGGVTVEKDVHVKGDTIVDGNVKVGGDVVVDGSVTVKEDVNVKGDVNVDGDVNIGGDVNVDGKINEGEKTPTDKTPTDDSGKGGPVVNSTVNVNGISVNPETATMKVGETKALVATVSPSNATNKSVTWSTSDSSVATVTEGGTVIAKSEGVAVVTAKTVDGGYTDSCVVTVKANTVAVNGVTLNPETATMQVGETKALVATVSPSNATNKNVTWSTSDSNVATVTEGGTVIAKSAGVAVITVKTNDGGYTDTCIVTVKTNTVAVNGVTLNPETATMKVGETKALVATVSPSNATNKNVTWSTSDSNVATVTSDGTVIAKSAGVAIITVKTNEGGYTDTCIVTVKANEVVSNATAKITFGDHISGATEIFASVVISEGGKTPIIDCNVSYQVVKVNDTVYHVKMTVTEGSHGIVALSVSGNGITYAESSMSY